MSNAASPPGLDNPLKIHYTTNRKGAVSYKRLAPYLRIKEIDRSSLLGVRRSFLLSIFILQFKKAAAPEGMQKRGLPPPGLDNPQKIHYTTNRKGAELQDGQLLPEIKKIDRMVWKTWRSIFFVIIVVSLRKFFRDLNGQTYHVHDQPQQAENDHEKREKLRQIHATSLPSPQDSGKSLSKKFRSRSLLRSIVDGNQSPGRDF